MNFMHDDQFFSNSQDAVDGNAPTALAMRHHASDPSRLGALHGAGVDWRAHLLPFNELQRSQEYGDAVLVCVDPIERRRLWCDHRRHEFHWGIDSLRHLQESMVSLKEGRI